MTELIQIADDQNTDTRIVRLVAKGEETLIPLFTYLISQSDGREFFLQVATANRNLSRFSPGPFDTIALSQMLALLENTGYAKDSIVANVSYYDASVEATLDDDGRPATPFIRPTTGAINILANTQQITMYLELPQVQGNQFRIGRLARSGDAEVAINPDQRILNHHIFVAGSTGSGKSHLLSNLAHSATAMGRSIILFDHKPDHQDHHHENPDAEFRQAFSLNGADPNLHAVRYWTLDDSDPNQLAAMLAVRAQDLDPEILAGTIFYRPNEENQAESFAQIATSFADENFQSGWTIQDLIAYIRSYNDAALNTILFGERGGRLDGRTMTALRRKMTAPGRIPSSIDPRPRANGIGNQRTIGNIDDLFTQPGLNVIRVSESNNRGLRLVPQQTPPESQ